jgi:GT2 family glycosyltransferase
MIKVLIGIPTLNGPDRFNRALASIAECTPFDRYDVKVITIDDGSTPANLEANKEVLFRQLTLLRKANLEMLMHMARKGIAASWNALSRFEPADVVVLLNDDIEVVPRWLDVLVHAVTKNPQIGMVSLNQYTALTKGQHRAAHPDLLPHVAEPILAYRESRLMRAQGQLLAAQGSIFAFRREVYDLVGGFDERYFCFYEELDFGVACCERGLVHAIADYPVVYHMGGATLSEPQNLDAKAQLVRSRALFHEKWGASIEELRARFAGRPRGEELSEWNTSLEQLTDEVK